MSNYPRSQWTPFKQAVALHLYAYFVSLGIEKYSIHTTTGRYIGVPDVEAYKDSGQVWIHREVQKRSRKLDYQERLLPPGWTYDPEMHTTLASWMTAHGVQEGAMGGLYPFGADTAERERCALSGQQPTITPTQVHPGIEMDKLRPGIGIPSNLFRQRLRLAAPPTIASTVPQVPTQATASTSTTTTRQPRARNTRSTATATQQPPAQATASTSATTQQSRTRNTRSTATTVQQPPAQSTGSTGAAIGQPPAQITILTTTETGQPLRRSARSTTAAFVQASITANTTPVLPLPQPSVGAAQSGNLAQAIAQGLAINPLNNRIGSNSGSAGLGLPSNRGHQWYRKKRLANDDDLEDDDDQGATYNRSRRRQVGPDPKRRRMSRRRQNSDDGLLSLGPTQTTQLPKSVAASSSAAPARGSKSTNAQGKKPTNTKAKVNKNAKPVPTQQELNENQQQMKMNHPQQFGPHSGAILSGRHDPEVHWSTDQSDLPSSFRGNFSNEVGVLVQESIDEVHADPDLTEEQKREEIRDAVMQGLETDRKHPEGFSIGNPYRSTQERMAPSRTLPSFREWQRAEAARMGDVQRQRAESAVDPRTRVRDMLSAHGILAPPYGSERGREGTATGQGTAGEPMEVDDEEEEEKDANAEV